MVRIAVGQPPDDGNRESRVKGPFSDIEEVGRIIGHPLDDESRRLHRQDMHRWAHSHQVPEDAPFDDKQALGHHIDLWHTPPFGVEKTLPLLGDGKENDSAEE